jgi:hypothetical protein
LIPTFYVPVSKDMFVPESCPFGVGNATFEEDVGERVKKGLQLLALPLIHLSSGDLVRQIYFGRQAIGIGGWRNAVFLVRSGSLFEERDDVGAGLYFPFTS